MPKPQKYLAILGAVLAWFALSLDLILVIIYRQAGLPYMLIQFFSYFTVLTNLLVAVYWSSLLARESSPVRRFMERPGVMTAVAVYITVVCVVYQIILRPIAELRGLQVFTTTLLHLVIPVLFVIYWFLYEEKAKLKLSRIPFWMIYPLAYLAYTLVRGHYVGVYPYPFVDVSKLGAQKVAVNSLLLLGFFILLSAAYIGVGKALSRRKPVAGRA